MKPRVNKRPSIKGNRRKLKEWVVASLANGNLLVTPPWPYLPGVFARMRVADLLERQLRYPKTTLVSDLLAQFVREP